MKGDCMCCGTLVPLLPGATTRTTAHVHQSRPCEDTSKYGGYRYTRQFIREMANLYTGGSVSAWQESNLDHLDLD